MDASNLQVIKAILKRGSDAKARRKGGGYVVIEIPVRIARSRD